ncbi:MAG TPA: hypothetical protein VHN80_26635 [Kineosporiaceae bacterium]|nr:hypothetical protein [Kineosporiaceae bacterium]
MTGSLARHADNPHIWVKMDAVVKYPDSTKTSLQQRLSDERANAGPN